MLKNQKHEISYKYKEKGKKTQVITLCFGSTSSS